jgi:16S rRNA (cytosine967-C5)-methyltransferase
MHRSSLLDLAAELLREVLKFAAPADGVVSAFFRRHPRLGPRERLALADTVYAVLRRRILWQQLAQAGNGPLERRLAILAWQGGAQTLERALSGDEAAWLERSRSLDRERLAPECRHNLPGWIAAPLQEALGEDEFRRLASSLLEPAPLDLRVNALRARREEVQAALAASGIESAPTPYSPWGLRIAAAKPSLAGHELFLRGAFEVQDEGSQLVALATGARRGELVVDFCAGGGGKTLALGAAMRHTGRLYAFDTSGHRLDALKARALRSGLADVHTAQIAHERDERLERLVGKIDRVLVDAPCSGLGTLRRNPDLKWRLSPAAVEEFTARQAAILAGAARLVKPGGRLVYATCSLLPAENEAVARAFGAARREFVALDAAQVLAAAQVAQASELVQAGFLRLWPHRHATDGFFAALWQRA